MATAQKTQKVGIVVDEFMDQVRFLFEREVRFILLNPHNALSLAKTMEKIAKKILTVPPEGVTPN